jgi:hypothetical protein
MTHNASIHKIKDFQCEVAVVKFPFTDVVNLKLLPVQAKVLYDFDGEGPGEITIRSACFKKREFLFIFLTYELNRYGSLPVPIYL